MKTIIDQYAAKNIPIIAFIQVHSKGWGVGTVREKEV